MPNFRIKDKLKIIIGIDLIGYSNGEIGLDIDILGFFWNLKIFDFHIHQSIFLVGLTVLDFLEIGTGQF